MKNSEKISTKEQFQQLINDNPDLTSHGFGVDKWYGQSFEEKRKELDNCYEEFKLSMMYLMTEPVISRKSTSYGLKHDVERWASSCNLTPTYIREGAFVAAVLALNLKYKRVKGQTCIKAIRLN